MNTPHPPEPTQTKTTYGTNLQLLCPSCCPSADATAAQLSPPHPPFQWGWAGGGIGRRLQEKQPPWEPQLGGIQDVSQQAGTGGTIQALGALGWHCSQIREHAGREWLQDYFAKRVTQTSIINGAQRHRLGVALHYASPKLDRNILLLEVYSSCLTVNEATLQQRLPAHSRSAAATFRDRTLRRERRLRFG